MAAGLHIERIRKGTTRWALGCLALALAATACAEAEGGSTTTAVALPPTTVAADVAPDRSPGCGTDAMTAKVGQTELRIPSPSGERRSYLTVPPAHTGSKPLPLVVDLHGYSEGAQVHLEFTKMAELGNKEGFATLTPQGSGKVPFWNSFGSATPDDVAFLTSLVAQVGESHCIDRRRTFVAGMSNGAFMASLMACVGTQTFAAAAMVAGLQFPKDCEEGSSIPIIAFHGTDDTFVQYEGGFGDGVKSLGVDPAVASTANENLSIPDAAAAWAKRNGCAQETTSKKVAADVEQLRWRDCVAATELNVIEGGGHSWPGSEFSGNITSVVGTTTKSIDATKEIWKFFKNHPDVPRRSGH